MNKNIDILLLALFVPLVIVCCILLTFFIWTSSIDLQSLWIKALITAYATAPIIIMFVALLINIKRDSKGDIKNEE